MRGKQTRCMKKLFSAIHNHMPLVGVAATAMLCGYAGLLNGGETANCQPAVNEAPSSNQTKQVQIQSKTDSKDNKKNESKQKETEYKEIEKKIKDIENRVNEINTGGGVTSGMKETQPLDPKIIEKDMKELEKKMQKREKTCR